MSERTLYLSAVLVLVTIGASGGSQQPDSAPAVGPVIEGYGPVYDVPEPEFATEPDRTFAAVFDVARSPDDPSRVNPSIVTVARYLNMHGRAGVELDKVRAALVLHGGAGKDALDDAAYRKRFDGPNPNLELIGALRRAGVRVVLCGQTAGARGFARSEVADSVEVALSAMTALITLQQDGYSLIAF